MKIRIKGNTLRLRLSQTEVERIESDDYVSDVIQFAETKLTYTLAKADVDSISATFSDGQIQVKVPATIVKKWAFSDQIGFEANQQSSNGSTLFILVEKDFKCTIHRDEDESDLFDPPT